MQGDPTKRRHSQAISFIIVHVRHQHPAHIQILEADPASPSKPNILLISRSFTAILSTAIESVPMPKIIDFVAVAPENNLRGVQDEAEGEPEH